MAVEIDGQGLRYRPVEIKEDPLLAELPIPLPALEV
jgi:hypothetical protein